MTTTIVLNYHNLYQELTTKHGTPKFTAQAGRIFDACVQGQAAEEAQPGSTGKSLTWWLAETERWEAYSPLATHTNRTN